MLNQDHNKVLQLKRNYVELRGLGLLNVASHVLQEHQHFAIRVML